VILKVYIPVLKLPMSTALIWFSLYTTSPTILYTITSTGVLYCKFTLPVVGFGKAITDDELKSALSLPIIFSSALFELF